MQSSAQKNEKFRDCTVVPLRAERVLISEKKPKYWMYRIWRENPPNCRRENPQIGKQFWLVTVKVDFHKYKEKIAHHTRPVG